MPLMSCNINQNLLTIIYMCDLISRLFCWLQNCWAEIHNVATYIKAAIQQLRALASYFILISLMSWLLVWYSLFSKTSWIKATERVWKRTPVIPSWIIPQTLRHKPNDDRLGPHNVIIRCNLCFNTSWNVMKYIISLILYLALKYFYGVIQFWISEVISHIIIQPQWCPKKVIY